METSQDTGRGKMFMDVGKSTVQLSRVMNYITVCKPREDTPLQTKMMRLACYIPYEPKSLLLH